jgi:hypothetical protein
VWLWRASATLQTLICHAVHSQLFTIFLTVVWVRKRLHCNRIGFACRLTVSMVTLLTRFGESLRDEELLPSASTLNQKTTHGVQPHPHIVVCPSFLFFPVIRIVNVVFSWLPFSYKMENLSRNDAERSSLVVHGYSRKEKPWSSLPLLTLGLWS